MTISDALTNGWNQNQPIVNYGDQYNQAVGYPYDQQTGNMYDQPYNQNPQAYYYNYGNSDGYTMDMYGNILNPSSKTRKATQQLGKSKWAFIIRITCFLF